MSIRAIPVRLRTRTERLVPAFGRGRRSNVACHAPFTSMYLDQHGFVRACCQNAFHVLGNVTREPLLDIWRGEKAQELRRAMERHDLSSGCEFCEEEVLAGRPEEAFSRWFADFPVTAPEPAWPRQLELSITNTCNLQCVMCNGEWSSSIRSQREGRPPLDSVYGDEFFEQLGEFVPHLDRVKIYGGEPFLAAETLRAMELIVDSGRRISVHLTTNGTQWSPRVERILDMLPVDVAVSLDAATAATYESIRIGSSWERVNRNLDRFVERADRNGTGVTVTFCLMVTNWHEFGAFCRAADARGLGCAVNTVTDPSHLSLYRLPEPELRDVVERLEAEDEELAAQLTLSRSTWTAELHRLRNHLDRRRDGAQTGLVQRRVNEEMPDPFAASQSAPDPEPDPEPEPEPEPAAPAPAALPVAPVWLGEDTPYLEVSGEAHVVAVPDGGSVLGVPVGQCVGRPVESLQDAFVAVLGPVRSIDAVDETGHLHEIRFVDGARLDAFSMPTGAPDGGSRLYLRLLTEEPSGGAGSPSGPRA